MKNTDYLKGLTIAHRGLHNNKNVKENTLSAFKHAMNKNISIEFDIHILKDNEIVVFHDQNLKRMTGINKNIRDLTYQELQNLNINYHIPTLDEVLKLVNCKVLLDIEIKYDKRKLNDYNLLIKKLDNYKGKFIIKSFHPEIILWFKIHKKEYVRGLLISKKYRNKFENYFFKSNILISIIKPDFLAVNKEIVKDKRIIHYRSKGLKILTWTIKNKYDENLVKGYTDSVISENIKDNL